MNSENQNQINASIPELLAKSKALREETRKLKTDLRAANIVFKATTLELEVNRVHLEITFQTEKLPKLVNYHLTTASKKGND